MTMVGFSSKTLLLQSALTRPYNLKQIHFVRLYTHGYTWSTMDTIIFSAAQTISDCTNLWLIASFPHTDRSLLGSNRCLENEKCLSRYKGWQVFVSLCWEHARVLICLMLYFV